MSKIIVAVDDGHGKNTAGKSTPAGYKENEFNHYTKEYLIDELEYNDFKIVDCSPTRDDNSLADRCNRANNGNADIFVSIHFNAMGSSWQSTASGIETYYHDSSTKGKKLANKVHNQLIKGTTQKNRGIKSDYSLYTNGLYVLRKTSMPAILVECGFMDNKTEAKLMKSTAFRKECSQEICKGICNYFSKTYKSATTTTTTTTVKYYVQAGAFSNKENAKNLVKKLEKKGFNAIIKTS